MFPTSFPLLLTKLHIPGERGQWVHRPRLFERLDRARGGQTLLLSAPAGYGKTVLLGQWIASARRANPARCFAWVTLDEADNDPVRYWSYLLAALQTCPGQELLGSAFLETLHAPQAPPLEQALVPLINEVAQAGAEMVLVLDDIHSVSSPQVHAGLGFFIEHLPPNLLLLLAGRSEPPLPLARLRARGLLSELRTGDLRFSSAEAVEFFQVSVSPAPAVRGPAPPGGQALSSNDLDALNQRVEGWAAGLQLAALSMSGLEDRAAFIHSFTGEDRYILDYLTQEILSRQPQPVSDFLLKTAVLGRMNAGLCAALLNTGGESAEAQQTLEALDRANLFIIPLDNTRTWYRYHRLFADLLQNRLAQEEPALIPQLHQRAAQWFAANRLPAEAFRHAAACGDLELAAELLRTYLVELAERGETATLQAWLEVFPHAEALARPEVCLGRGFLALYQSAFDQADVWAQRAAAALAGVGEKIPAPQRESFEGQLDSIRATLAVNRGRHAEAITLSRSALDKLPESVRVLRGLLYLNLGDVYNLRGEFGAAVRAFEDALEVGQLVTNHTVDAVVISSLGDTYSRMGRLRQAESIQQQALMIEKDQLAQGGGPLLSCGKSLIMLARIYLEWNEIEEARRLAEKALDYCQRWRHPIHIVDALLARADALHAAGECTAAWAALDAPRALLEQAEKFTAPPETVQLQRSKIARMELTFRLREGDLPGAQRCVEANALADLIDPLTQALLVWLDILNGEAERGLAQAEKLQAQGQAKNWLRVQILAGILQALAHQALGDVPRALQALEQTLALAEPEGYVRLFSERGARIVELLERERAELRASPHSSGASPRPGRDRLLVHVEKILLAVQGPETGGELASTESVTPPVGKVKLPPGGPPKFGGGLTERECQVLRLLAAGLSNDEIAAELFLSLNTVKTHLKRIFEKLGVNNRMEAVNQARQGKWI